MQFRVMQGILLGALGTTAAVACGGTVETVGGGPTTKGDGGTVAVTPEDPMFVGNIGLMLKAFACDDPRASFDDLRTSTHVDFLELLEVAGNLNPSLDAGPVTPKVIVSSGKACSAAADEAACTDALVSAPTDGHLFGSCGGCVPTSRYLAYTKGDQVGTVGSRADLLGFVGAVDSYSKAWIVAIQAGYEVDCASPWIRENGNGGYVLVTTKRISDCPVTIVDVLLQVSSDGTFLEVQTHQRRSDGTCIGRRPAGLVAAKRSGSRTVGAHFAGIARLEAASVDAFRILRGELAAHGAPRRLLTASSRAARDEIRHARTMARIAKRHGGIVEAPVVERMPVRSLEVIATENAVEGCVRETYGALEGLWQARAAGDRAIRNAMKSIAVDETRHGALSWAIADWLDTQLEAAARRRVRDARRAEVEAISKRLESEPSHDLVAIAGVPSARRATAFAAHLRNTLWR